MNRTKWHLVLLTLIVVLLSFPSLVALAKELGSLTITGPGIKGELRLTDPKIMMDLEQSGFFDQAVLTKAPKDLNLDAGYTIIVQLNLDGKIVPYIEMVYYPTNEGQPGYVHYTSRYHGGTLQTVDEWDILGREADSTFRSLMTANHVTLQSALVIAPVKADVPAASAAKPVTAPLASPAPIQTSYIALAIAVTIMLLVGAGLAIRRRNVSTG